MIAHGEIPSEAHVSGEQRHEQPYTATRAEHLHGDKDALPPFQPLPPTILFDNHLCIRRRRNQLGPDLHGISTTIERHGSQLFFDSEQLVIFRHTIRAG